MKDTENLTISKEDYDNYSSELADLRAESAKRNKVKRGLYLKVISMTAFILGLIPFFPNKMIVVAVGIISGILYSENYEGTKLPLWANLFNLGVRVAFILFMLFLPMMFWFPVLFL